jgi:cysteine-rich repeat protein
VPTGRVSRLRAAQLALCGVTLMLACSGGDEQPARAGDAPGAGASSASGASTASRGGTDSGDGGTASQAAGASADGAGAPAAAGEGSGGEPQAAGGAGSGGDDAPDGSAGEATLEPAPEQCFDGLDNDLNDASDCADPACEQACASSCTGATKLADPGEVAGNTRDHAAQLGSSCTDPEGESGSEIVYDFVAETSGMLDVTLSTAAPELTLSLRQVCGDDSSELTCATTHWLSVPVTAGDALFIVVDGYSAAAAGKYVLSAATRPIACGDGIRDPQEGCDDGDKASDDGCSSSCQVESSEQNPNDALGEADTFDPTAQDYYYGELSEPGDVDWVAVEVPGPSSTLRATTRDYGDGACELGLLDSAIAVYGPDQQLIAENDDDPTADGLCALVIAEGLEAGTYYVRVAASPADPQLTFPYALDLSIY